MKDKLQQELLTKIKPGTKPSDIKKQQAKNSLKPSQKTVSPPPIAERDEGYESDKSNQSIPVAPPLPNQAKSLQNQIKTLQRQLQVYQDFKEVDLKIKEGYKQTIADLQTKNQNLTKTIATMKSQAINPTEVKPEPIKTFLCSECNQAKPQTELSRVFGKFSFCLECSKKARQEAGKQKEAKPQVQEFTCHLCSKNKQEVPNLMKLDQTLQEYQVCFECRPLAKEFNEADLITDDLWEKYPYSSASEILELEFGIKNK